MNITSIYQPRNISFLIAAEDYLSFSAENRAFVVAGVALALFCFIGDVFVMNRYPQSVGFFVTFGVVHVLVTEIYSRQDYLRIIERSKQRFSEIVLLTNYISTHHEASFSPYTVERVRYLKNEMNQKLASLLMSSTSSYPFQRQALQKRVNAILARLQIEGVLPRSF